MFSAVTAKLIRDAMNDQKDRERCRKPIQGWIIPDQWTAMKARFDASRYKERSEKAKAARHKASKWYGGSIPMTEHFRRLVSKGGDANMVTVFLATHRKDGKLIDERAEPTYSDYLKLQERAAASAPTAGEAGTSLQPAQTSSTDELWVTTAGGLL
ncbi:plant UBX domain-containing protein 8 [Iris pallida]|uniref:Plant UBX domain-containing protein 8 n=1 Tax=Iris pallida TaxID=29817 RepID=A0AAX6HW92_IRIPA|nr:plant UBX domain-containing protein 8 [Iris pallida]